MVSNMCSRCLAYGVQVALQRAKKSGSFPVRAAISATLLAHEGAMLLPDGGQQDKELSYSEDRSIQGIWWRCDGVHIAFPFPFLRALVHTNEAS
jgi:hypothetical protein